MFTFDDPGIAVALLAIILGLRLALFVVERLFGRRTTETAVPVLVPDDVPEGDDFVTEEPAPDTPERPIVPEQKPLKLITEILDSAIIAVILVFFLIRPFILQAFYIPTESMVPTLREGDKLLAAKYTYAIREPKRREIVVFHAPRLALETQAQKYDPAHPTDFVKRVVGIPGDRIKIVANVGVFVNGVRQQEPYVADLSNYDFPDNISYTESAAKLEPYIVNDELVVPDGFLFVLGDNRTKSHDSHVWGLLERKALVGKAFFIFWPPDRWGVVR